MKNVAAPTVAADGMRAEIVGTAGEMVKACGREWPVPAGSITWMAAEPARRSPAWGIAATNVVGLTYVVTRGDCRPEETSTRVLPRLNPRPVAVMVTGGPSAVAFAGLSAKRTGEMTIG